MKTIILLVLLSLPIFAQSITLRDTQNQFDYIIITIDDYAASCELFKVHKENHNNFSVVVVTKDQILDEFSSKPDIQNNIRDFISYAGNEWQDPKPNYFLFAGDIDSIPNFSFRSVNFQDLEDTSHSDYYYGLDTSETDSTIISYSIGRIAARNITELENYFKKVITYENDDEIAEWQSEALFVTDDHYNDVSKDGDFFISIAESISDILPEHIRTNFVIPIDTSLYFGDIDSIEAKIGNGQSSVLFCGHANDSLFTHESLFVATDVMYLENYNKPFYISIMGGQQFSNKGETSIVNEMILSENGALASINSVGIHFVNASRGIFHSIWENLYTGMTIGEILIKSVESKSSHLEIRKFNIFGDPSIILKYDKPTSVEEFDIHIPENLSLYQNYPNPFNPSTVIPYEIPAGVDAQSTVELHVTLKIFDILGREVTTLVNELQNPGGYQVTFNSSLINPSLTSGTYFYTLKYGDYIKSRKMMLLK